MLSKISEQTTLASPSLCERSLPCQMPRRPTWGQGFRGSVLPLPQGLDQARWASIGRSQPRFLSEERGVGRTGPGGGHYVSVQCHLEKNDSEGRP